MQSVSSRCVCLLRSTGPMSLTKRETMESQSSKPFILKSTSALSLNERFSQVLLDQVSGPGPGVGVMTLDQAALAASSPPVVLLVKKEPSSSSSLLCLQGVGVGVARGMRWRPRMRRRRRKRRSVWTRLGWQQMARCRSSAHRRRGFWSFTNKYSWRARRGSAQRWGRGSLQLQSRLQTGTTVQKLAAAPRLSLSLNLPRGGAGRWRGGAGRWRGGANGSLGGDRGRGQGDAPTKKQLDKDLDKYMSLSKKHLDKQLDDYMSRSRSRLDADLDEYMAMAGDALSQWD